MTPPVPFLQPQHLQQADHQRTGLLCTADRLANQRERKKNAWDEMFVELTAESQRETRLAERWKLYVKSQREKEIQFLQEKDRRRGNS